MKLKIGHIVGLFLALVILLFDIIVLLPEGSRWFKPLIGVAFFLGAFQFWLDIINEGKRNKEIEEKFLEFVRSISDSVRTK